jgi:hypothetical protein
MSFCPHSAHLTGFTGLFFASASEDVMLFTSLKSKCVCSTKGHILSLICGAVHAAG